LINVTLTVLEILKSEQVSQRNHPPSRFARQLLVLGVAG
jgi:hypothetical protein